MLNFGQVVSKLLQPSKVTMSYEQFDIRITALKKETLKCKLY